jgi:hypothetical protein
MEQNETKKSQKIAKKYYCENCYYYTSNKTDYNKHLTTDKHQNASNETNMKQNIANIAKSQNDKIDKCICGKLFFSRTSLWRHKKKCQDTFYDTNTNANFDPFDDKNLMKQVILQLPELVKSIVDLSKDKGINHSHNQTHSHSHNKTFNLQFFLNETCKDAMNISDFVQTIKPQLMDLENTGRLGYVDGITNIILNNLKTLKIHERPLHCSDQKREVIYIKDNNTWTKEHDDKPILTKAIKVIANENIKNIGEWRKEYPDCTDYDSKKNSLYLKIVSNSMSGSSKEESDKNLNKIISNISKEVIIDKN